MSFYPIGCTGTYVMQEKPLLPLYARLYRYKTDMEYQATMWPLCQKAPQNLHLNM